MLNSSPSLLNVKIIGNRANYGAGIFCAIDSSPSLQNVTIKDNDACLGGGIYCYHSSPSLQNVTITGNSATYGGGICCDESSPSLDNVTLTDNSAAWSGGGIYCGSSDLSLENLTKTDNRTVWNDGRIISYESSPSIVNSIVSDNTGDFGIYVNSGNPIINYSDFYNNEGGNFYGVNDSIGVNVTTNTNGDSCDVFYNIQLEPLFVDPLNGDYHLSWVNFPTPDSTMSPCIDAGDPSSPLDPDGTIADMGAYYFNQDVSIDEPEQSTEFNLTNYPNPISSHINDLTVSFSIHKPSSVQIQLFNIKGQLISTLVNEGKNIGDYIINHSVSDLSSGIYFTKMSIDGVDREIRKVILLK